MTIFSSTLLFIAIIVVGLGCMSVVKSHSNQFLLEDNSYVYYNPKFKSLTESTLPKTKKSHISELEISAPRNEWFCLDVNSYAGSVSQKVIPSMVKEVGKMSLKCSHTDDHMTSNLPPEKRKCVTRYIQVSNFQSSNQLPGIKFSSLLLSKLPYFYCQTLSHKSNSRSTAGTSLGVMVKSFPPPNPFRKQKGNDVRCFKSTYSLSNEDMCNIDSLSNCKQPVRPTPSIQNSGAILSMTDSALTLATRLIATVGKNKNFVFSPVSINVLLGLLAAGSSGQTLDEFLLFLKSDNIEELKKCMKNIVGDLLSNRNKVPGENAPKLIVANGIWLDESLNIKEKFKSVSNMIYDAQVKQVDFKTKFNKIKNEVNLWAEDKTMGLIKDILPPNSIDSTTRLILTNAIYFQGRWVQEFEKYGTIDRRFHILSGGDVKVPFMTSKEDQYVVEFNKFKVLRLPYRSVYSDNRQFSMYIFLPNAKDGLTALGKKFSSGSTFIKNHIPKKKVELRNFWIPKFNMSYNFEASDILKNLGLVSAFTFSDGFKGITDSSLSVSKIFHNSFIEVNERGTKVAAVTAVTMYGSCESPPRKNKIMDFVADHPFLFIIREDVTGLVPFFGQVLNPLNI